MDLKYKMQWASKFTAGSTGEILNDSTNYYGDLKEDYISVKRGASYIENEVIIDFDLSRIPSKILKLLKKLHNSKLKLTSGRCHRKRLDFPKGRKCGQIL